MKIKRPENQKKTKPGKSIFSSTYLIAAIVLAFFVFLFIIWQQKSFNVFTENNDFNNRIISKDIAVPVPPPPSKTVNQKSTPGHSAVTSLQSDSSPLLTENNTVPPDPLSAESGSTDVSQTGNDGPAFQSGSVSTTPTEGLGVFAKRCSDSTEIIKMFFNHLDTQEYMKPYGLAQSSEVHFTLLIQRLLDNPPVVSGETDDLFTILQNTAHFFRVIGKDNIIILKGILDREKGQFENVLYNFYSIFQTPSCPVNSFNLNVQITSLYDYAGFFLNTMGGRLYLFRRDSMSRMVVSYYAILLIDQANKEARNKHGIEIKTAIDQLIGEMEASSNQLKFENVYLDNLYTLKEQYQ